MDRGQFLERVDAFRREGKSIREIAAELRTYKSKVQRALKNLAEHADAAVDTNNLIAGAFVGRERQWSALGGVLQECGNGVEESEAVSFRRIERRRRFKSQPRAWRRA